MRFTTVNGIQNPTIRMKVGEVQRWRFVNAGLFSPLTIQVVDGNGDPQVSYPIAIDGIPLGTITPQSAPLPTMGPGNRMDVLFKAPGPGTYYLYKTDERGFFRAGLNPREDPYRLATILVGEERLEMAIPPAEGMRDLLRPTAVSASETGSFVERVEFDIRGDRYVVNGAPFDPLMAPRTLVLNNVQKWTVRAKGGDHPFHIHVNPFLLIARNGRPLPLPEWRDTVLIRNGESVTFLTRYEDFTGQFVLHCHNLGHEDRGMMELVEVVPPPLQEFAYFTPPFRAPTHRFSDAKGRSLSLADFAGRVILLNFWASSCPPCRDEIPRLDDLQRQINEDARRRAEEHTESGPKPRDFVVLAASWDANVSAVQQFFEEAGVKNLDVYLDPNRALGRALIGSSLSVDALPVTMLIDGDGFVRGVIRRAAPWNAAEARTMVDYFLTA
ncbi:MAG: Blue copper oxidase CueO precursor [Microvirga sp.]|nr:Blue copper oxidase CueO precursor [Microvirga sp.]